MTQTPQLQHWLERTQRALARREHVGNVRRLRLAVVVGTACWAVFGLVDLDAARHAFGVSVGPIWLARFGVTPVMCVLMWRLFRRPFPSQRFLWVVDVGIFGLTSGALGAMSVFAGGLSSPYTSAVPLILICRGAFVVQPWRAALAPNLSIALLPFGVVVVGTSLRGVSASPQAWALLRLNLANVMIAVALVVLASHTAWRLRRSTFRERRVGAYDLLRPLAQGGQAEVWHAYHRATGRDVALKILSGDPDDSKVARLMQEFEILSRLAHPNVVSVSDYGVTENDVWFCAMELLHGKTLAELVKTGGPLRLERAVGLFAQVCDGLCATHDSGVIHRDLKPENIFVSDAASSETAKLLDFGISRMLAGTPDLTRPAAIIGTPAFMPPELAQGHKPDSRSDVYSAAASLWYALTGAPPFERETVELTLQAQLTSDRSRLRTGISGQAGEAIDELLRTCLAVDPAARPANAAVLRAALLGITQASDAPSDTRPTQTLDR